MQEIIITILIIIILAVGSFSFWKIKNIKIALTKREKETNRRMYELAILKELGDRVGYSLNVQKIIDIITGSLNQFIEYGAVSYMLIGPEKIIFKVHLEQSVSRKFIDDVQVRMLGSLSALMDKNFEKNQVEETLTGAILVEELEEPVRSFFNIPLVIGGNVEGILTVAHTRGGLYKEEEMTILYKITKQASDAVSRLQEVVEMEQRKLNSMVESMSEGVVMTDKDYRIVVVNPSAKEIIGISEKDDATIFDFIDNLGGKFDIRGKLEESVKLDKFLIANDVFIRNRFFQIFVSPVKNKIGITKGEILGGVVLFHDITHEKELERMREDFTSMMVHELRSPLDNIKKMSEVIREEKEKMKTKELKEYMKMIYGDSSRMLELVNDLLDIAKLESGKFEINKKPANIKEIIESRVNFFKTSAKDANIELTYNLNAGLPENIEFDSFKIPQVLNNLISNAIKFTKSGGKIEIQAFIHKKNGDLKNEIQETKIDVFAKNTKNLQDLDNSLIVAVSDTGVGISSNNIPKLFNKFKQFQETAEQGGKKGTGLGLAIVKGIIEAHNGKVGVISEEGEGSVFYFILPVKSDKQ